MTRSGHDVSPPHAARDRTVHHGTLAQTPAPRGPAAATATAAPPLAAPRAARAPAPTFDRARYAIPHKTFVLDNGLTLVVHEDHSVPVVGVNLWYHVGSRNEERGKTGFAHLFEHFFFNGSEHYPHGFREAMDDLGANNRNGTTSTDRTNFFETCRCRRSSARSTSKPIAWASSRRASTRRCSSASAASCRTRSGRARTSRTAGSSSASPRRIYPAGHPYSWSTIGSMDDLDAASLEDVKAWYQTYYGPNNCVLSLAGDITPERALALVKKYFDGIPPGPPLRRASTWVPRFDRHIRDEMEDRVPQARVYRVYHAPRLARRRRCSTSTLAAGVLSGSRSARLDRRLVYDKALATNVSASVARARARRHCS